MNFHEVISFCETGLGHVCKYATAHRATVITIIKSMCRCTKNDGKYVRRKPQTRERERERNLRTTAQKATKEGSLCFRFVSFLLFAFRRFGFYNSVTIHFVVRRVFIRRYFVGFWLSLLRESFPFLFPLQFTVASLRELMGRAATAAQKLSTIFHFFHRAHDK